MLKARFDVDNLALTSRAASSSGHEPLVACVQQLKASLDLNQSKMIDQLCSFGARINSVETSLSNLSSKIVALNATLPAPRMSPVRPPLPQSSDSAALEASSAAATGVSVAASHLLTAVSSSGLSDAGEPEAALLHWHHGAEGAQITLKGLSATEFFAAYIKGTFHVRASDKARCDTLVNCFKATASPDELRSLATGVDSTVAKVSSVLQDRVIGRIALAYGSLGREPPKVVASWKSLSVNALTDRITELDAIKAGHKKHFADPIKPDELARLPARPAKENPFAKRKAPAIANTRANEPTTKVAKGSAEPQGRAQGQGGSGVGWGPWGPRPSRASDP